MTGTEKGTHNATTCRYKTARINDDGRYDNRKGGFNQQKRERQDRGKQDQKPKKLDEGPPPSRPNTGTRDGPPQNDKLLQDDRLDYHTPTNQPKQARRPQKNTDHLERADREHYATTKRAAPSASDHTPTANTQVQVIQFSQLESQQHAHANGALGQQATHHLPQQGRHVTNQNIDQGQQATPLTQAAGQQATCPSGTLGQQATHCPTLGQGDTLPNAMSTDFMINMEYPAPPQHGNSPETATYEDDAPCCNEVAFISSPIAGQAISNTAAKHRPFPTPAMSGRKSPWEQSTARTTHRHLPPGWS